MYLKFPNRQFAEVRAVVKGDEPGVTLFGNGLSAPLARFRTIAAKLRERGGHHAIRAACRIERAIEEESPARR